MNQALENYRFDDAANSIYQFFWGSFCDWYLEIVKLRLDFAETADKSTAADIARPHLSRCFEASLRLLSPFMPFLTEEIWHALYDGNPPAKSIALDEAIRRFRATRSVAASHDARSMKSAAEARDRLRSAPCARRSGLKRKRSCRSRFEGRRASEAGVISEEPRDLSSDWRA